MTYDVYKMSTAINAPVNKVFKWHEQDGAISRLTPPWAPLQLVSRKGAGIKKGVQVMFRIKVMGITMPWLAEHIEYRENDLFRDRQLKGPFAKWEHTHRFIPDGDTGCVMEDEVNFRLPFGWLAKPFYGLARREFDRMFAYRHRVLKHDLENSLQENEKKRILVSGASGTIGSILVPYLRTCGHEVIRLVRKKGPLAEDELFWDPYQGVLELEDAGPLDVVINLNGLDISRGKWTKARKKKIVDSRIVTTLLLVEKMKRLKQKPEVFISSSAIGYYGEKGDEIQTEAGETGDCFISTVCDLWEQASQDAQKVGIRTVQLRIGIVLTPAGGALERMEMPFKLGLGVRLSHGRQYMSWISMDDCLSAFLHIINHSQINGPVNLTAPKPVTNKNFSLTLARVFSKKVFFVMPKSVALLLWGQMGEETLLTSARVVPEKLLKNGFKFQHEDLFTAFRDLLGR